MFWAKGLAIASLVAVCERKAMSLSTKDIGVTDAQKDRPQTPFDRIGGRPVIAVMVNHFYDIMDENPDYKALRAMHAPDLSPMRESLTDFLTAWMGGPRDWFEKRPGACIMSAHGAYPGMTGKTAAQWVAAMKEAAELAVPEDRVFTDNMIAALSNMARSMAARAEDARKAED